MIIQSKLSYVEEEKLLRVLIKYKVVIRLMSTDIKYISPFICMYQFLVEEKGKSMVEHQRRFNPKIE
jgi:hypothetical protein